MKNVLIAGGCGFIGEYIIKKFHSNGYNTTVLDLERPPYPLVSTCTFIKCDVLKDKEIVREAVRSSESVIHLIGLASSSIAQQDPMKSFKLNLESLQIILDACREFNKKIIFPSSATVYGMSDELPIRELTPVKPLGIYAWHKYLCEQMIKSYQQNYGVKYVILRLFNVYGKGNAGVIGIFINKAKKGEVIESFGPFQYRDFIYAGDVASAFYTASVYTKAMNRVINIGSGHGYQIKDILNIVNEIFPDMKWTEKEANFDIYDSIADITAANILLDLKPNTTKEFMKSIMIKEMI